MRIHACRNRLATLTVSAEAGVVLGMIGASYGIVRSFYDCTLQLLTVAQVDSDVNIDAEQYKVGAAAWAAD